MKRKDLINEYIGIVAIIVIVIIAAGGIYFYITRQPEKTIKEINNATISLNQSAPKIQP